MSIIVHSIICIDFETPIPLQIISVLSGHNSKNSDENGEFSIKILNFKVYEKESMYNVFNDNFIITTFLSIVASRN